MYRLAAVLIVAGAVLAAVFWTLQSRSGEGDALAVEALTVVRLKGEPREKGRALGRALADRIRASLERVKPEDEGVAAFAVESVGKRVWPLVPGPLREEIEGVAEGAGISVHEALYLNTRFELAAFGMGGHGLGFEGAADVGADPLVRRTFSAADLGGSPADLVAVIHEDLDPPLVLVCLPGMVGAFAATRGEAAAALRPIEGNLSPVLTGLCWPLFLRYMLEHPPVPGEAPGRRPNIFASLPLVQPGGSLWTLNVSPNGATWYRAKGRAFATDAPVTADSSAPEAYPAAGGKGAGALEITSSSVELRFGKRRLRAELR